MNDAINQRIQEIETQQAALRKELAELYRQSGEANRPPLTGMRVLDFSWAVFGPYSTQVLSDMGAEVIKVERVDGGDVGRQTYSAYFTNRNKQSLAVDLRTPEGREIVLKLGEVATRTAASALSPPVGMDGEITVSSDLVFERITGEELWACTSCKACDEICPVDIEIVALSLESVQPITVTYNGGQDPELWLLRVGLSEADQATGSLTAVKTHCNGGTYNSVLFVQPRFTFIKGGGPGAPPGTTQILDTGFEEIPPIQLIQNDSPPWVNDLDPWRGSLRATAPPRSPGARRGPPCTRSRSRSRWPRRRPGRRCHPTRPSPGRRRSHPAGGS